VMNRNGMSKKRGLGFGRGCLSSFVAEAVP
jgi:hypothetical protein